MEGPPHRGQRKSSRRRPALVHTPRGGDPSGSFAWAQTSRLSLPWCLVTPRPLHTRSRVSRGPGRVPLLWVSLRPPQQMGGLAISLLDFSSAFLTFRHVTGHQNVSRERR